MVGFEIFFKWVWVQISKPVREFTTGFAKKIYFIPSKTLFFFFLVYQSNFTKHLSFSHLTLYYKIILFIFISPNRPTPLPHTNPTYGLQNHAGNLYPHYLSPTLATHNRKFTTTIQPIITNKPNN